MFIALIAIMASGVSVITATDNQPSVHIHFLSGTVYDCDNPQYVTASVQVEINPSDTPVTMWVAWRVDGLPGSVDQRVFDGPVTNGQIVTVTVGPLPSSGSYNVHLSATAYVTDNNYGQAGLDYNVGWPWNCEPKPHKNTASATPRWGCNENGDGGWYKVDYATIGELDRVDVGDNIPLSGDLRSEKFDIHLTVFFKSGEPLQIPLVVSIPAASECGTKPPPPVVPPVVEQPNGSLWFCQWTSADNIGPFWVFWNQGDGTYKNVLDDSIHSSVGPNGAQFGAGKLESGQWLFDVFGPGYDWVGGSFTLWSEKLTLPFVVVSGQPVFPRESVGWDLTGRCQSPVQGAVIWDQGPAGSDGIATGERFEVPAWNQGLPIATVTLETDGTVRQMLGYAAMLPNGDDIGIHQSAMPRLGDSRDGLQIGMRVSIGDQDFVVIARQVMEKTDAGVYSLTHTVILTCTPDWTQNVVFTLARVTHNYGRMTYAQ